MKGLKRKIEDTELTVVINEEDEFEKEMALLNAAIEESEEVPPPPPPPPPPLEVEYGEEEEELEDEKESLAGGDEQQERDSEEYQRQTAEIHLQEKKRSQKRIDRLKEKRSKVRASDGTSQDSSISKLKQIKKQRVVKPFDSSDEDSE